MKRIKIKQKLEIVKINYKYYVDKKICDGAWPGEPCNNYAKYFFTTFKKHKFEDENLKICNKHLIEKLDDSTLWIERVEFVK